MGVGASTLRECLGSVYAYKRLEGCVLVPKGYVPICIGVDEGNSTQFMVHIKVFKDASFCELLEKSAEEYGFHQNDGILKIVFEGAQDFEDWISKKYRRKKIMRVKSRRSSSLKRSSSFKKERKLC